jgi:predicted PurR-regulated permease PerM
MLLLADAQVLDWVAPGSSAAAIIVVVIIFLKQMRYMQNKYEKSLQSIEQRLTQITDGFSKQVDRLATQQQQNEERRMQQIQSLFDKMMVISSQSIQAIAELKQGFMSLTAKVEGKIQKEHP